MKKTIAILLLAFYASSTVGMVVNFHYCHGRVAKISFLNFDAQKGCKCNPKAAPKDCCRDEMKYHKSDIHRYSQTAPLTEIAYHEAGSPSVDNYCAVQAINKEEPQLIKDIVQRSCPIPIYIFDRILLI